MPLLRRRPLLRAAAVGGGAYALGKRRERRMEEEQQQTYAAGQQSMMDAPAPVAPAPRAGGVSSEDVERLKELGKLREQGILTDDEFAQQKAKILGTG